MPTLKGWAAKHPHKAACLIAGTGESISYRELDRRADLVACLLIESGLVPGDGIAILLENDLAFYEIVWGARRTGAYYTPIGTHLKPDEAAYIIKDCGAKALFTISKFAETVEALKSDNPSGTLVFALDGQVAGAIEYESALGGLSDQVQIPEGPIGKDFFYSSGTTGQPKGIKQPLYPGPDDKPPPDWVRDKLGLDDQTIYLSPAPLYHAAPLRFTIRVLESGGTDVIMRKFDAAQALEAIEKYRITHSQWVPTMFFRLLELPEHVRTAYDLSGQKCAVHAAAPCPAEIKQRMIDWWGPVIWEYYAGSEKNGATCISTPEWLAHRGSVGRACIGRIHILDDYHNELPPGETGDVFFEGPAFVYHNDTQKTQKSRTAKGWSTIGDVGYLDQDGYLYLTDRRSHMIISGGVNIYPAEIENALSLHPAVADVAVFGIPNREFGEEVKAVVQLKSAEDASPELAQELLAFCRERLSSVKCPRSVDFETEMPRQENGKLFKHVLKSRYIRDHAIPSSSELK